jgi:hypothetical protein
MYYNESGNMYDGLWKYGKRQGIGMLKLADGGFYRGNFHEGHIEGKGTFTYGNKDVYHGWFQAGKKAGKGLFTWANGNVYNGEFRNDRLDGYVVIVLHWIVLHWTVLHWIVLHWILWGTWTDGISKPLSTQTFFFVFFFVALQRYSGVLWTLALDIVLPPGTGI